MSALRGLASHFCHQASTRTWAPAGEALVVCQRCIGVYAGLTLGVLVVRTIGRCRSSGDRWLHAALVGQLPLHVWLRDASGGMERTASGLAFGVGLAWFLVADAPTCGRSRYQLGVVTVCLACLAAVLALARWTGLADDVLAAVALVGFVAIPIEMARALLGRFRE